MSHTTTFSFKHVLLAGALAVAGLAQAQAPATAAPAGETAAPQVQQQPHKHQRAGEARHKRLDPAQRAARHQQRLAKLKQDLGITAEQEPAWHAFTASMLPGARPAPAQRAAFAELTTPQRIERMRAMHQARGEAMHQRTEAVLRLYGALTPAQQHKFDQQQAHAGHHGARPHRGGPARPTPRG